MMLSIVNNMIIQGAQNVTVVMIYMIKYATLILSIVNNMMAQDVKNVIMVMIYMIIHVTLI